MPLRLAVDLRTAIERAVAASREETRQRIARALGERARTDSRLRHPERFADPAWVETPLATARPKGYESARTGATLRRLLYAFDRS